ncbi:MAG: hypothetical protein IJD45_07360 [Clostridia bacterium]|nr:hypothetical protein [Clostridia bacterium]
MKFTYSVNKNLPPLAWIAEYENGDIKILCGENVEIFDNFFVSGAWSGDFDDKLFEKSEWFCGTGGKIEGNQIIFSTPTHVTEGLYLSECDKQKLVISNSLYLLMAKLNYHLDVDYQGYETDFNTVTLGINNYKKEINVLDDENNIATIKIFYYRNIIISNDNTWNEIIKSSVAPFTNFNNYYTRLLSAMTQLQINANSPKRKHKYGVVSTVSRGYDAPCCAVIAKKIGAKTAVTFKATGKYAQDSGVEIAKALGFENILERHPDAYKTSTDFIEAYYLCTGELGASISFSAFSQDFKNNLVFTGERGDSIWNCHAQGRNNAFCFKTSILSHLGMSEKHLWDGSITVPMPLFGATAWESIYNLSNSEEMTPWRLNNNYDRPISRRICEEAGLKRNDFGVSKHGAGFIYRYDTLKRIKSRMSSYSAKSFHNFVKANRKLHLIQKISYYYKMRKFYFLFMLENLKLDKLGVRMEFPKPEFLVATPNPNSPRYLIPWASSIILEKYENILRG